MLNSKDNPSVIEPRGLREKIKQVDEVALPSHNEEKIFGVVTDCMTLVVREKPSLQGAILATIPALTEVAVDYAGSIDGFYKICTATGLQGFCMKKFIAVRR